MAERKPYWELLRDPRWQKKRLEVMQRDGFICSMCESEDSTLNVHHAYYERGLMPWEYPAETLRTLCESCHKIAEKQRVKALRFFAVLDPDQLEELIGIAKALRISQNDGTLNGIEIAENSQELWGMIRVFQTLDMRETSRCMNNAIPEIPKGGEVCFELLEKAARAKGVLVG